MKTILISIILSLFLHANLIIDHGELFELGSDENITILGDLNITTKGTFKAGIDSVININNDWINNGNFLSSFSSVNFIGYDSSVIRGNNTFYNFTSKKSTIFDSNKTQKITNRFILNDGYIRSTIIGVQSIIDLSVTNIIDTINLEIEDSKIIGQAYALNPLNSIDNGNNILWFSSIYDCQNIGSGQSWYDKLYCQDQITDNYTIKYILDKNSTSSQVTFDSSISSEITATPTVASIGSGEKNIVKFIYKTLNDVGSSCSKDLKILLFEDGTAQTGFEADKNGGCVYEDPTLENWSNFKDSTKVTINKITSTDKIEHDNSNSVIVIDVNLTTKLIIGGKK